MKYAPPELNLYVLFDSTISFDELCKFVTEHYHMHLPDAPPDTVRDPDPEIAYRPTVPSRREGDVAVLAAALAVVRRAAEGSDTELGDWW